MKNTIFLRFCIGLVAGLCAALFPRLVVEMTSFNSQGGVIELFSERYLYLSLIFATLIGIVVVILEADEIRRVKEVFMSALALPGLLSGSANTLVGVNGIEQAQREIEKANSAIESISGYSVPIEGSIMKTGAMPTDNQAYAINFISSAYAIDYQATQVRDIGIGIRHVPQYHILLDKTEDAARADEIVNKLQSESQIQTKVIQENNSYLILKEGSSQEKTSALIEVIRLNREKNLTPSLVEVKR